MTNTPHPLAVEPSAWRVRVKNDDPEEWSLLPAGGGVDYLDREGYECQPLYSERAVHALVAVAYQNAAESALEFFKGLDQDDEWWPGDLRDSIMMGQPDGATAALASIERRTAEAAADRAEQHLRTHGIEGVLSAIRGEQGND